MGLTRKRMIWGSGLVGMLGVGAVIAALELTPKGPGHVSGAGTEHGNEAVPVERTKVETIRPKQDPNFVIAVQQLAAVEPYFQAELRSRVAGPVRYIHRNIGDVVHKGDLLVEIDAPDQRDEVARLEAIIRQREKELKLAEKEVLSARAAKLAAEHNVKEKEAKLLSDEATWKYREMRFRRYEKLQKVDKAIDQETVDQAEEKYEAAQAEYERSQIAVPKAQADLKEKQANLDAAEEDVELKKARIRVARSDRDVAQALADYAKVHSEFDGIITERTVDPGAFVQNSATAHTEPLLSVARTDIVTVVTKIPDNDAPFVGRNTEAVILLDNLPDTQIIGRVSRFPDLIRSEDRTMRVEVDLFNGTKAQYDRYVLNTLALLLSPVGVTHPCEATALFGASRKIWRKSSKGNGDVFPTFPKVIGVGLDGRHLLPGMSGYLRLMLRKFQHSYLVPRSAVFSRGGKNYIIEVVKGQARLVPVQIQVEDGQMAKIVVMVKPEHRLIGEEEVYRELDGSEQIVISRQSELSEGQPVEGEPVTAEQSKELRLPPAWRAGERR